MGGTVGLLVLLPGVLEEPDQPGVVDRFDRCGSPVLRRHELERTVGGQRTPDVLRPLGPLERLLEPGRLELALRVMRLVAEGEHDLHVAIVPPRAPAWAISPERVTGPPPSNVTE